MLADTVVRRRCTAKESIYARDGLELSRSTICGWHEQLADLVEPVVEVMPPGGRVQRDLTIEP